MLPIVLGAMENQFKVCVCVCVLIMNLHNVKNVSSYFVWTTRQHKNNHNLVWVDNVVTLTFLIPFVIVYYITFHFRPYLNDC